MGLANSTNIAYDTAECASEYCQGHNVHRISKIQSTELRHECSKILILLTKLLSFFALLKMWQRSLPRANVATAGVIADIILYH